MCFYNETGLVDLMYILVADICLNISDMVLVQDPAFRKVVELYAKDENAFFKDFASAFSKLLELGVTFPSTKPWYQFW